MHTHLYVNADEKIIQYLYTYIDRPTTDPIALYKEAVTWVHLSYSLNCLTSQKLLIKNDEQSKNHANSFHSGAPNLANTL